MPPRRHERRSGAELYGDLARTAGLPARTMGLNDGEPDADRVSHRVTELRHAAGLPERLADCGVDSARLGVLADEAAQQWTAQFNPRDVESEDLKRLYEEAF